jgi:hypothetical protein
VTAQGSTERLIRGSLLDPYQADDWKMFLFISFVNDETGRRLYEEMHLSGGVQGLVLAMPW